MRKMTRAETAEKIRQIQEEIKKAGPIHYRDLRKHLNRLTAQLRQYDRFQAAAKRGVA